MELNKAFEFKIETTGKANMLKKLGNEINSNIFYNNNFKIRRDSNICLIFLSKQENGYITYICNYFYGVGKFVRILVNDILIPSWYFVCDNKVDVYYFFEKYYRPIIYVGVNEYMRGNTNTYWGNTILKMSESPAYRDLSPSVISSQLENETYVNRCKSVDNGEILLLNKDSMSYFCLVGHSVKIIQEKVFDNMVFPGEEKYDINDIVIKRWSDGIHYYAKVGKYDIIDRLGQVKYNSYAEAHVECLKWLEKQ